jgi:hypothetical protein
VCGVPLDLRVFRYGVIRTMDKPENQPRAVQPPMLPKNPRAAKCPACWKGGDDQTVISFDGPRGRIISCGYCMTETDESMLLDEMHVLLNEMHKPNTLPGYLDYRSRLLVVSRRWLEAQAADAATR